MSPYLSRFLSPVLQKLRYELHQAAYAINGDIGLARLRLACDETAAFIEQNMPMTRIFRDKESILSHSVSEAHIQPGDLLLEFGVFSGGTINQIAGAIPSTIKVYGFDSFEGLPEDWRPGFLRGRFAVPSLPKVAANVELIKGWFDRTLPEFIAAHPGKVGFLHVDCDLYSSTVTIFQLLRGRFRPGAVVLFDEYFNYPGWQASEHRAFTEFVESCGCKFEYLAYNERHEQLAIRFPEGA
jgi:hypothetical protein